jgi:energy-converting hydrogenase Eha subunit C
MEDLINRLSVSFIGVLASWGLMDVSIVLACIASIATIINATLGILEILKNKK